MTYKTPDFQLKVNENGILSPVGGVTLISAIFEKFGLRKIIDQNIAARPDNGAIKFTDSSYIESIVTMQILGGESVDGLSSIRQDEIVTNMLGNIPGKTSSHNYLQNFVDKQEEAKRGQGKSYVPEPNKHLKGFEEVTRHLLKHAPHVKNISTVTLDQDATLIPTEVNGACYNYKSEKSFETFNTYCPEYDMIINSEYRDGNVSPGYRQLENLQASLELLPESVKNVRLRSDTAGYQIEFLKYCALGKNERFGVIEFAISSPVTKALKQAVQKTPDSEWKSIPDTAQECAEIVFVPNSMGTSNNGPEYRFIAIREEIGETAPPELRQMLLFDEEELKEHPIASLHPTVMAGKVYKVFALVTNMDWSVEEIVVWQRKRCGKSEEMHRVLKDELAGGHVVTSALGANAAWWQMTVLSFNILTLMKKICLPGEYHTNRPKTLRRYLFEIVARLVRHARKMIITLYRSAQTDVFIAAWNRLKVLRVQVE